jgi:MoCo/4Fe-4S cofactor protein with predicted Tat translocation signal
MKTPGNAGNAEIAGNENMERHERRQRSNDAGASSSAPDAPDAPGVPGVPGVLQRGSLEQLTDIPEFKRWSGREFPEGASELNDPLERRQFLKLMGASLALMGVTGCYRPPQHKLKNEKINAYYWKYCLGSQCPYLHRTYVLYCRISR